MQRKLEESMERARWLDFAIGFTLIAYVVAGLAAMWMRSPRVPYADQWRFYGNLLSRAFPWNVLATENGHHEVLPNWARIADIYWMQGDQNLLIGIAMLCAIGSFAVVAAAIGRGMKNASQRRAAIFAVALGVFWLGNERVLTHSSESIHAYMVTLFAFTAIVLAACEMRTGESRRIALASACAVLATFSFGSGIATFPALLFVLGLRQASVRSWIIVIFFLGLALVGYVFGKLDATTSTIRLEPVAQGQVWLHWLAAPFVYVFWPLLDSDIAARLPSGALRESASLVAGTWTSVFGSIRDTRMPQIMIGLTGICAFSLLSWRAFRDSGSTAGGQRVALGIAMFALAVGGAVVLSRLDYFDEFPGQIQATRYLVWSSLFWSGLLTAALLQLRSPRKAAWAALAVAVLMGPSQFWMDQLSVNMRVVAEQVALGGAIGVLDRAEPMGENVPEEMLAVLPGLSHRGIAMYAWPETQMLGRLFDFSTSRHLAARNVQLTEIDNRFGNPGMLVQFDLDESAPRVLLLDADGIVQGIAQRFQQRGAPNYRGWLRGIHDTGSLHFAALP